MRHFFYLFFVVAFAFGQNQTIEVEYRRNFKLDMDNLPAPPNGRTRSAEREKQIKEFLEKPLDYQLITNSAESLWTQKKKIDNSLTSNQGRGRRGRGFRGTTQYEITYKQLKEKRFSKSNEIFGKKVLIKDSLQTIEWKITREKKEILGYQVRKATAFIKNDSINITAWYAPKLNYANGPSQYFGLPGLILELTEVRNGGRFRGTATYQTTKISPTKDKIEEPAKGKIYTEKEFQEEMENQRKKFRAMRESGVNTRE